MPRAERIIGAMTRIEALTRRPGLTLAAADLGPVATLAWSSVARLLRWDEAVLLKARRLHGPRRTLLARALTRAGDGSSWTLYGLLLLATFDPAALAATARLATAAGLATLFSQALKRSLGRARPDRAIVGFEALSGNPDRFSFPSGHTAAAFAVAVAFAGAPFGLGAALFLFAIGIAVARVYLGAHYPLDVAAGAALGSIAGLAARALLGG
jgi:undecaprenyl-diphosphatase